jgi:hypothetical protein
MAMVEIARFLKAEASGWRFGEAVWFLFCIAAVVSLSVWWGDGACGIAAAVTGVANANAVTGSGAPAVLKEDAPQRELPKFENALEPKAPPPDESDVYSKPVEQKQKLEEWKI